jgi:hypothetical protein
VIAAAAASAAVENFVANIVNVAKSSQSSAEH